MLSIIILAHNCYEHTKECLISIAKNTIDYEIILVDNGSDPAILQSDIPDERVRIIRNEENLGCPKAFNQGINETKGEYICILNNDVVATPGWAEHLIAHLDKYDLVGPCTNSISGPQQVLLDEIYNTKEELYDQAVKFYNTNKGKVQPFHRLVAYCLLGKREVFDKIGLFDEAFGQGNYEDDDLCLRAIEAGFRCGICRDVYIHHFGLITFKFMDADYTNLLKKNKKIFDAKWPKEKYKELANRNNGEFERGDFSI